MLARIIRSRELLYALVSRDIKIKYKQSVMGLCWAVLMPAVVVAAGLIVRAGMASLSGTSVGSRDVAGLLVVSLPWALFVAALRFATGSLVANTSLVTKVACPREVFPIAAVLSQLVDTLVAGVFMLLVLAVLGAPAWQVLLVAPPLVGLVALFAAGLGMALATANLFFRDVKYLVEASLMFGVFITPVFYDVSLFGAWEVALLLNPLAPPLEALRATATGEAAPALGWLVYSAAASVAAFVVGVCVLRRYEPLFAESI